MHPALQPVLRKSNVVTLLDALQRAARNPVHEMQSLDYIDGYTQGILEAYTQVAQMWRAAEVCAKAESDLADPGELPRDTSITFHVDTTEPLTDSQVAMVVTDVIQEVLALLDRSEWLDEFLSEMHDK